MALTEVEIDQIAQGIADKIAPSRVCRCGVATWEARDYIDFMAAGITHQKSAWVLSDMVFLDDELKNVEAACQVDTSGARGILKDIEAAITRNDWEEVERSFKKLKPSIWDKLEGRIHG